jgi:hypothetical protein
LSGEAAPKMLYKWFTVHIRKGLKLLLYLLLVNPGTTKAVLETVSAGLAQSTEPTITIVLVKRTIKLVNLFVSSISDYNYPTPCTTSRRSSLLAQVHTLF